MPQVSKVALVPGACGVTHCNAAAAACLLMYDSVFPYSQILPSELHLQQNALLDPNDIGAFKPVMEICIYIAYRICSQWWKLEEHQAERCFGSLTSKK